MKNNKLENNKINKVTLDIPKLNNFELAKSWSQNNNDNCNNDNCNNDNCNNDNCNNDNCNNDNCKQPRTARQHLNYIQEKTNNYIIDNQAIYNKLIDVENDIKELRNIINTLYFPKKNKI